MAGLNPKGHGKIEIRGLKGGFTISLENAEENQFYSVILVSGNHDYELGKVYTEKNGKGREELTFNIHDLEASGFQIDKLNGIIIKRGKDILLGGYLDKEDNSIQGYINRMMKAESKKIEEVPEERKEVVELVEEKGPEAEVYNEAIEAEEEPEVRVEEEVIDEIEIKEEILEEVDDAQIEAESVTEWIEVEDVSDVLENIETNIEIDQFIEAEAGEEFVAVFEPVMEIDQYPEPVAIEVEGVAIEAEETYMETEAVVEGPEFEPVDIELQAEAEEIEPIVMEMQEAIEMPEAEAVAEEFEPEAVFEEMESEVVAEEPDFEQVVSELEFEPIAIEQEPVAIEQEPIATEQEPIAIEREPIAIEQEPVAIEPEAVAKERGPEFEALELESVVVENEPEPVAIEPESIPIEFEPTEYKESREEIVEINKMDYEHNRRIIQRDQTTNYILNILRYFPHVDPFRINLHGYKWWRIDYQDEEKGFLPYFSYVIGGEKKYIKSYNIATSRELMSSFAHYLFGLYHSGDEVKYYVYAVPGGFYKDEQPHGGVTGFNTWFPSNEISGYWLLYIDPLTGKVIYPINPMIPTE